MGRHYEDDQRDTVNRFRKRRGGLQRGRQRDPGQKELVLVIGHDPGGHFGFERPEPDLLALLGQEPGQGSSPGAPADRRSEEHTSELQSPCNLVCRLLLEKKKNGAGWVASKLCCPPEIIHRGSVSSVTGALYDAQSFENDRTRVTEHVRRAPAHLSAVPIY